MITAEHITYIYDDKTVALKDVSFKIDKGDTIAIIGGNGAGKSTILKVLMGILTAKEGRLLIEGEEVVKENLRSIRKKIGMVFQNPDDMLFMYTVYDDIAFGLRNNRESEKEIEYKIRNISKYLEIDNLLTKHSSKLSGGQKRKVALAAVLVMEPKIIIFDEPTSFLDPKGKNNLIKYLKNLNETKIIATHDLDMVKTLCNKTIVLKEGKIEAIGRSAEILGNIDLLERCGLI